MVRDSPRVAEDLIFVKLKHRNTAQPNQPPPTPPPRRPPSMSSHKVFCPLCKQTMSASSEAECIEHMSTCKGFAERHGEQPRKKRAAGRLKSLPSAADSAKEEHRVREYSSDGTFTEKIPEALLDALHWWKDETQAKETAAAATSSPPLSSKTKAPWKQDDGTDRFYWHALLSNKPNFVSIFSTNGGTQPYLIDDPSVNNTQTAREQCALDGWFRFSDKSCACCGLPAKLRKARCSRCKIVSYCSTRCQQTH